jgi:hypothetical protein
MPQADFLMILTGRTQSVRYDKAILVGNRHTSAIRCGSETGSW